jgi:predicted peptidase
MSVDALADDVVDLYEERTATIKNESGEEESSQYRLLKPKTIEPGKTYPVILFLHGAGERGDDNKSQLKYFPSRMAEPDMRDAFPCYVIAPQCKNGPWWVSVNGNRSKPSEVSIEPNSQLKLAIQALQDVMAKEQVDKDRVYLTGLSMGGFGSWELAAQHPDWFACVVPICGGGETKNAEKLVGLPIWAWHGDQDNAVPVVTSRMMIQAIRDAGGTPRYTELPGVGHNSWTPAYSNEGGVIPWMFTHSRGKPTEDQ